MRALAILLLALTICCPIYLIEYYKYESFLIECDKEWNRNARILDNPLCADANERLLHGEKVQSMCIVAEQENNMSPRQCALQHWWHQFWVYTFFHQMTDSYWKVMPVALVVFFASIWLLNQQWTERVRIQELAKLFRPNASVLQLEQPPLQHVPMFRKNKKRQKSPSYHYLYEEDSVVPRVGTEYYE